MHLWKKAGALLLAVMIPGLLLIGCAGQSAVSTDTTDLSTGGEVTLAPETSPSDTISPETNPPETTPPETNPPETTPPETTPPETTPPETDPPEPIRELHTPAVIMYHLIMEKPFNNSVGLFVRPSDFAAHLDALNAAGYTYLFADEFRQTEGKSVVLTFDDGYEDNYTTMFPILREKGGRATIFLITDLIGTQGYLSEAQIREMAASGLVSFGSHTKSHPDLTVVSEATLRGQFTAANEKIEALTGRPVKAIAYPAGAFNDTVLAVTGEYYTFAYTTKAPDGRMPENLLRIPRYRANRGVGGAALMKLIEG